MGPGEKGGYTEVFKLIEQVLFYLFHDIAAFTTVMITFSTEAKTFEKD